MTDYRRKLILDALKVRLLTVTTANGYKSQVVTVLDYLQELHKFDQADTPAFMFEPDLEGDLPVGTGRERKATLPVVVFGVVYDSGEATSAAIENLIGDLRKAILAGDVHFGTHPTEGDTLAQDTDISEGFERLEDLKKPIRAFRTVLQIEYRYMATSP